MRKIHSVIGILFFAILFSSCTPNIDPNSYSVGSVGRANRVAKGTIINVRQVNIQGTSGLGASSGAAAGGVAGSAIGGNDVRLNIIGAVGGAVAGGLAGGALEEGATKQLGIEYIIECQNGALLTVVQGDEDPLEVGQDVFVLYGGRTRVISANKK